MAISGVFRQRLAKRRKALTPVGRQVRENRPLTLAQLEAIRRRQPINKPLKVV